jgi:transposase InsO family protein
MLPILKRERTYFQTYATRAQARVDLIDYIEEFYNEARLHSYLLIDYIEEFYNEARLHSYLDYVSPNEFECVRES